MKFPSLPLIYDFNAGYHACAGGSSSSVLNGHYLSFSRLGSYIVKFDPTQYFPSQGAPTSVQTAASRILYGLGTANTYAFMPRSLAMGLGLWDSTYSENCIYGATTPMNLDFTPAGLAALPGSPMVVSSVAADLFMIPSCGIRWKRSATQDSDLPSELEYLPFGTLLSAVELTTYTYWFGSQLFMDNYGGLSNTDWEPNTADFHYGPISLRPADLNATITPATLPSRVSEYTTIVTLPVSLARHQLHRTDAGNWGLATTGTPVTQLTDSINLNAVRRSQPKFYSVPSASVDIVIGPSSTMAFQQWATIGSAAPEFLVPFSSVSNARYESDKYGVDNLTPMLVPTLNIVVPCNPDVSYVAGGDIVHSYPALSSGDDSVIPFDSTSYLSFKLSPLV